MHVGQHRQFLTMTCTDRTEICLTVVGEVLAERQLRATASRAASDHGREPLLVLSFWGGVGNAALSARDASSPPSSSICRAETTRKTARPSYDVGVSVQSGKGPPWR